LEACPTETPEICYDSDPEQEFTQREARGLSLRSAHRLNIDTGLRQEIHHEAPPTPRSSECVRHFFGDDEDLSIQPQSPVSHHDELSMAILEEDESSLKEYIQVNRCFYLEAAISFDVLTVICFCAGNFQHPDSVGMAQPHPER